MTERTCPHCHTPNPLDLSRKCERCKKPLPPYCFGCLAEFANDRVTTCASCGRRRWNAYDIVELACVSERGTKRQHRWIRTFATKDGKMLHEWRCMKCLVDETRTDAFSHFPETAPTAA